MNAGTNCLCGHPPEDHFGSHWLDENGVPWAKILAPEKHTACRRPCMCVRLVETVPFVLGRPA